MSTRRPFREIKLQWLDALNSDTNLSDNAVRVANHLIHKYMNGHTEKAWPSYATIADATGKSVKTVQRAIRELEAMGWLDVQRGNGVGHPTIYSPTESSIVRATEAREKTDNIVTLHPEKGGQICPQRGTKSALKGGQNCPPNLVKEIKNKPNAREAVEAGASTTEFIPTSQTLKLEQWEAWLASKGYPDLSSLGLQGSRRGQTGFTLPCKWPPKERSWYETEAISFFAARALRSTSNVFSFAKSHRME